MSKRKTGEDSEEDAVLQEPKNRAIIERKRQRFKDRKQRKEEDVGTIVKKCNSLDQEAASKFTKFTDFPLSERTLKGLQESGFTDLTEIQQQSLGYSIAGQDVVGAAKTGSGKTLALLIPFLLECLYTNRWTKFDGLGALVISPTRELAYQIFEVLNKVGAHHEFSAALLIGGTNVEYEKNDLLQ
uniref:ATP-dependent RNA helicase n=1 Tax=Ditylenchus dipsaci TaxID=166011 RepID=A0A915EHA8_9BILA